MENNENSYKIDIQESDKCNNHNVPLTPFRNIKYCIYCELEKKTGNISKDEAIENYIENNS